MRNLKLTIEYDGTDFVGWQSQERGDSIQEAFERALIQMTGVRPILRVAGRTDSGVHARAQVASFKTESKLSVERFAGGLNALVPRSVSVHSVEEMPLEFDAKRSSQWKRYRYSVYQARHPAAQIARYSWHLIKTLDLDAMRAASQHLLGEQDFQSFRAAQCQAKHARREMFAIEIDREERGPAGYFVHIVFHADAFVRHMCRVLAGTLVEVGRGDRTPDSIRDVLLARDRREAGVTAPAHGLCLMQVSYEPMPGSHRARRNALAAAAVVADDAEDDE
ncbi:MAG: tRNA pseudouridine(38-40) synthase TruA [Deltaproteobacteria bacterium]|nr:tRNA pseudouridine(38-40) synthase TruA [Deltaproteobacteria bacterium]